MKQARAKRKRTKFARVSVYLNGTIHLALMRKAERDGQSMNAIVRSFLSVGLRDYIDQIEKEKWERSLGG